VETADPENRRIHAREIEDTHSAEAISDCRHSGGIDFRFSCRSAKAGKKSRLQQLTILLEGLHEAKRVFVVLPRNAGAIHIKGEADVTETGEGNGSLFFKSLRALHRVVDDDDTGSRLRPFVVPGEFASQGMAIMVVVDRSDARCHLGYPP
jgi:hypothetical protein